MNSSGVKYKSNDVNTVYHAESVLCSDSRRCGSDGGRNVKFDDNDCRCARNMSESVTETLLSAAWC